MLLELSDELESLSVVEFDGGSGVQITLDDGRQLVLSAEDGSASKYDGNRDGTAARYERTSSRSTVAVTTSTSRRAPSRPRSALSRPSRCLLPSARMRRVLASPP